MQDLYICIGTINALHYTSLPAFILARTILRPQLPSRRRSAYCLPFPLRNTNSLLRFTSLLLRGKCSRSPLSLLLQRISRNGRVISQRGKFHNREFAALTNNLIFSTKNRIILRVHNTYDQFFGAHFCQQDRSTTGHLEVVDVKERRGWEEKESIRRRRWGEVEPTEKERKKKKKKEEGWKRRRDAVEETAERGRKVERPTDYDEEKVVAGKGRWRKGRRGRKRKRRRRRTIGGEGRRNDLGRWLAKCCGGRLLDERQIAPPLVVAGARNIGPMRVAALAVGEEGEEEDGDEEEEDRTGHRHEARGLAMCPPATAAVGGRSRRSATKCPIFFVLLLLLLLPVWILTIVVDASPLHPVPPYKGESRLPFFVDSLEQRCSKVRTLRMILHSIYDEFVWTYLIDYWIKRIFRIPKVSCNNSQSVFVRQSNTIPNITYGSNWKLKIEKDKIFIQVFLFIEFFLSHLII